MAVEHQFHEFIPDFVEACGWIVGDPSRTDGFRKMEILGAQGNRMQPLSHRQGAEVQYRNKSQGSRHLFEEFRHPRDCPFHGASPTGVLRWISKEHAPIQARLLAASPAAARKPDVIEMDEIYAFVQKKAQRAVVWSAFSRRRGRVIAYHFGGKDTHSVMALYRLARRALL
jgi:hypothetical protein